MVNLYLLKVFIVLSVTDKIGNQSKDVCDSVDEMHGILCAGAAQLAQMSGLSY